MRSALCRDTGIVSWRSSCVARIPARFVTVFARQTPIPTLLRFWERLVQYGDPLLHQFLALAWLLRNRRVLLETRIDDVPEAVSRLRLQSEEDLKIMWEMAVELRRSTPQMVCEILQSLCYEKDWGVRHSEMLRALKVRAWLRAAESVARFGVIHFPSPEPA